MPAVAASLASFWRNRAIREKCRGTVAEPLGVLMNSQLQFGEDRLCSARAFSGDSFSPKFSNAILDADDGFFLPRLQPEISGHPSISGMTHVRTSPFYPQSNGKIERWHKSLKRECIRPWTPLTLDDARRLIQIYVDHYNMVRLHSAIGYVTPQDRLAGRQAEIHAARDRKLEEARRPAATSPAADGVFEICTLFNRSYNDLAG